MMMMMSDVMEIKSNNDLKEEDAMEIKTSL